MANCILQPHIHNNEVNWNKLKKYVGINNWNRSSSISSNKPKYKMLGLNC